jgi:hypothetical protein
MIKNEIVEDDKNSVSSVVEKEVDGAEDDEQEEEEEEDEEDDEDEEEDDDDDDDEEDDDDDDNYDKNIIMFELLKHFFIDENGNSIATNIGSIAHELRTLNKILLKKNK